jgi:YbgC/YbaW family acyl-CoA thioester hydrolase
MQNQKTGIQTSHHFFIKTQYEDIDMCEVLYHPNYFKYLDRARNQFFKDKGYAFEEQFKDRVGFALTNISAQYFLPIVLGDEVVVQTSIESYADKSVNLIQQIVKEDSQIIFTAKITLVFADLDKRKAILFNSKASRMLLNNKPI